MEKLRVMNKHIFRRNLMMTVYEILGKEDVDESKIKFKIIPVYEKDKPLNSVDDIMRLILLSEENIGNRLLTVEQTVRLVACNAPLVPIWINISLNRVEAEQIIFNFETSLRIRKPSVLRNVETGHPPFKAVERRISG